MNSEYIFQFNVPSHNDVMAQNNLMLNMKAVLLPMCPGINPVVSMYFTENNAVSIRRIISMEEVIRDCEKIAVDHFKTENQDINIVVLPLHHITQLIPKALS